MAIAYPTVHQMHRREVSSDQITKRLRLDVRKNAICSSFAKRARRYFNHAQRGVERPLSHQPDTLQKGIREMESSRKIESVRQRVRSYGRDISQMSGVHSAVPYGCAVFACREARGKPENQSRSAG